MSLNIRTIQKRFQIGMGTIERTIRVFDDTGLSLDNLKAKDPKAVEELFYPQEQIRRKKADLPDFGEYYHRIHAPGSKVNITFLWYEYKEEHACENRKATIIAAQIPRSDWYDLFRNDTYADACMDRITKSNFLIELEGSSLPLICWRSFFSHF